MKALRTHYVADVLILGLLIIAFTVASVDWRKAFAPMPANVRIIRGLHG